MDATMSALVGTVDPDTDPTVRDGVIDRLIDSTLKAAATGVGYPVAVVLLVGDAVTAYATTAGYAVPAHVRGQMWEWDADDLTYPGYDHRADAVAWAQTIVTTEGDGM